MKARDILKLLSPVERIRTQAAEQLSEALGGGSVSWASITGKPATFPPSAHTHVSADITDLSDGLNWNYYATTWTTPPTQVASITGGVVLSYTLDSTTRYRFVPC